MKLIAHPLVTEGYAWELPMVAPGTYFIHPRTLQNLKDHLWAQQKTVAAITYAQLLVILQDLREKKQ